MTANCTSNSKAPTTRSIRSSNACTISPQATTSHISPTVAEKSHAYPINSYVYVPEYQARVLALTLTRGWVVQQLRLYRER